MKGASNICRLTQFITLTNIRDIIYAVHPPSLKFIIGRTLAAYILNKVEPGNLNHVEQLTRVPGIHRSKCLRSNNAIYRNTKQALRYLYSVCTGCPHPIDKDISN